MDFILNSKYILGDICLILSSLFISVYAFISYSSDKFIFRIRKFVVWSYLIPIFIMIYFFDSNLPTKMFLNGAYVVDLYSYAGKIFILLLSLTSILFNNNNEDNKDLSRFLYYPLAMIATVGCFIVISSYSLIYLLLGFSMISICTSFMVLLFAIGYNSYYRVYGIFIFMQLLSFVLLLFGIAYIYSITGNLFYNDLADWVSLNTSSYPALLVGIVTIVLSIMSICGAFPFTSLMIRLGSIPQCVVMFVRIVVVFAVIMALSRLLVVAFPSMSHMWKEFVLLIGVCSIVIGTLGTLLETEIGKIISYCSISHIGFLFLSLGIPTNNSIPAMLIYLIGYVVSYVSFVGYGHNLYINNKELRDISQLKNMGSTNGMHSIVYGLSALAYSGIPPFIIFIGKMSIMGAILRWEVSYLLIILIIIGIFQCIWSLRLLREMYTPSKNNENDVIISYLFSNKPEYGVRMVSRFAFLISVFFLFFSLGLVDLIIKMSNSIG